MKVLLVNSGYPQTFRSFNTVLRMLGGKVLLPSSGLFTAEHYHEYRRTINAKLGAQLERVHWSTTLRECPSTWASIGLGARMAAKG